MAWHLTVLGHLYPQHWLKSQICFLPSFSAMVTMISYQHYGSDDVVQIANEIKGNFVILSVLALYWFNTWPGAVKSLSTDCVLVMPCDVNDVGKHWLRHKALSESMLTYHQVINKVLWYSFKVNVYSNTQEINIQILLEIYTFELAATFPGEYELIHHNLVQYNHRKQRFCDWPS